RQAIPEVKSKIGEIQVPLILADRQMVQLNPAGDVRLDMEAFQAMLEDNPARAVNLYRGDFLADFYLVDSNPFENWAETIRERLRRQILRALDGFTQMHLQQGNYEDAQSFAWKQLEIDPLREPAYRQLMLALANSGQRNAAVCQYEMYQHRLNDELGIEPGEETQKLYEQIQADAQRQVQIAAPKKRTAAKAMPVFMLTDIESSTQLWDTYHQAMLSALLRHNTILEEQISRHGGRILELRGDGVKAVFEGVNPLVCVLEIQKAFAETGWGEIGTVKIRIGLHGVPPVKKGYDYFTEDDKYYGPVLNHTARIMDAGWGGQILVSEQVHNAFSLPPGASWIDFGQQTLRSLEHPVHIFGLTHRDLSQQSFPPLRTLSNQAPPELAPSTRPRHNLTSQPTAFVGRQRELSALEEMLANPRVRLVTLVGPGGMGKTRLAFAVSEKQVERRTAEQEYLFPDGVFFVSLVSINAPEQIIPLIAKTLNVPIEASQSTEPLERSSQTATTQKEKLVGYLATKRMLLVLDNFEHIIEGAEIVSELLETAPTLQILVTSRERLHIREEQIYPISGLEFPEWEAPDEPGEYTAMELFLQSARRVQPAFRLDQDDMVYLTRICRLVGGMPLGLELAASWVEMLSLYEIALEIQRCLDFLETDLRNIPDRHRSIRAVFNSSWNLLNESEKQLFARLSIFRGSFPREAAEKIAEARLQTLANLAGKSLLQYDPENHRYQIHELLRQYGAEQLASNPEVEYDTLFCFSTFYCREAEQHIQLFMSGQTQIARERFELDATNIRTAWDWAVNHAALSLVDEATNGLCAYYDWNWRAEDGLSVCSAALHMLASQGLKNNDDSVLSRRLRAKLLSWQGYFNLYYRHDLAIQLLEQSLTIINQLMDMAVDVRVEKSQTLLFQGLMNYYAGDLINSKALLKEALELSKETGLTWMVLRNLLVLGEVARYSGSPSEAKRWFGQCLTESRAKGNRWGEINALSGLGWAARGLLAYQQAQEYYDESIELAKTSNHQWELIRGLEVSGFLAIFLGQFEQAHARFFEAVSFSKELGVPYRTLSSQNHMGVAKWLSGDFLQAETAIRDSLALSQDLTPSARIFPTACLAEFFVITGRYREANTQVRVLNTITQGVFIDPFTQGRIHRILGWIALAEKKYPEARAQFEKSVE
ncbi:MAG TPA: BTAD domain-containing putative transcriptional regulator, partial [Anaerolineales bacterium]|nr:BTAD domain-containing putative transcriptional regulator [Anaerolineales bacterium]